MPTNLARWTWIAGLFVASAGFVASSAPAAPADGIDAILSKAMTQWEIPGAAVAVVSHGKIVFARGYGIREAGRPERVDENTIFGIGSVTKSFTATATAMLVDDGKLDWDRPIIDDLPSLHFSDPWITAHATVRDLGSMRLGIDAELDYIIVGGDIDRTARTARYIAPQVPFRSFQYSNTSYAILGKLIEERSARSWDQFITDRVLRPLDMKSSFSSEYQFIKRENLARCWLCVLPAGAPVGALALNDPTLDVAAPHGLVADPEKGPAALRWQVLPWRSDRSVLSAGMIYSSAADMAQYVMFHLTDGEHRGRRLMSEAQMHALHALQTIIPATDSITAIEARSDVDSYGLGWMAGKYRGRRLVFHAGGRVGFGAEIWMFPDDELGIIFLQNLDHQSSLYASKVMALIADRYLGIATPRDEIDKALARPADWKPVSARPAQCRRRDGLPDPATAAKYAGTYRSDLIGDAKVMQEGGALSVAFEPQSVADLVPAEAGGFTACFRGYQPFPLAFRFSVDAAGKPLGFVLGEGQFGISPLAPESQAVTFKRLP